MQKKSQKKLFDKVKFLKSQKNLAKIKIQTIYQKKIEESRRIDQQNAKKEKIRIDKKLIR